MNLLQKIFTSTYLFINSVAIPIIHNGCCIQYSYGSMMQPCCHKLTDVLHNSECSNDTGLLGSASEFINVSCNQVNLNITNSI